MVVEGEEGASDPVLFSMKTRPRISVGEENSTDTHDTGRFRVRNGERLAADTG